jgi:hypothetical protein
MMFCSVSDDKVLSTNMNYFGKGVLVFLLGGEKTTTRPIVQSLLRVILQFLLNSRWGPDIPKW